MQKKAKKRTSKSTSKGTSKGNSGPPAKQAARPPKKRLQAASQQSGATKFVQDVLTRGEAAELTKDGKLPLRATHVIQKNNPDGSVELKRLRFKLF